MLALFEAPGFIRAHLVAADAVLRQLLLEDLLQFAAAGRVARPAVMLRRSLVLADKNVLLKLGH
jgi:hypothetical protein